MGLAKASDGGMADSSVTAIAVVAFDNFMVPLGGRSLVSRVGGSRSRYDEGRRGRC